MQIRSKSLKKNAILNAIRTMLSIVFPLITYPYVTRILHSENLGKVTFSQSIVSYFALIAALGVGTYAVREGAKRKSNKSELEQFSNEIFSTNIITTIIAYVLLAGCLLVVPKFHAYTSLILILSSSIVFTTLGVDWVNVIFEDYFVITVRSIVVQLLNIVLLFLFVKTENDYYKYAVLLVVSSSVVALWNFIYCRKYLKVKFVRKNNFFYHVKKLLVFFANNLAISLYCYSDSTMLGWMINDAVVGTYSVAVKAYTVIKTVIASVYTVCIPRLSKLYGEKEWDSYNSLVNSIFSFSILILLPAMVGIVVLAEPIVLLLGGTEYLDAVSQLRILSVALCFAIFGGVMTNCINIPSGKEKLSLTATVVAAVSNILLNFVLIPLIGANGAAITTVLAEFAVILVICCVNKDIKRIIVFKDMVCNTLFSVGGCGCVLVAYFVAGFISSMILKCIVIIVISVVLYLAVLIGFKNQCVYAVLNTVRSRFNNK